jgi:hypothetical protein
MYVDGQLYVHATLRCRNHPLPFWVGTGTNLSGFGEDKRLLPLSGVET